VAGERRGAFDRAAGRDLAALGMHGSPTKIRPGWGTRSPVIVERPAFTPRHESAWRRMGLTKPSPSSPRTGRGGFVEDSTKHLLRGPVPEIPLPADGRLVTPLSPAPGDVVVGAPAGGAGAGVAFTPKRPAGGRAHGDRRGGLDRADLAGPGSLLAAVARCGGGWPGGGEQCQDHRQASGAHSAQ